MNKFGAFAILALASLSVSCAQEMGNETMTQAIIYTTDADETAQLKNKDLEIFNDFCISSRDYVLADIKKRTNDMTSKAFNLFFSSAAEIGKESLEVQQHATERLAAQLANPEAPVEGATDGVDEIIADGQAKIQGQSQPNALLTAFRTAVSAVSSRVGNMVSERLTALQQLARPGQLLSALTGGCSQVATYEDELRGQFETYKQELGEEGAKYADLPLDAVPCATSTKIIRSEGICGLWRVAVGPVKKIMGQ